MIASCNCLLTANCPITLSNYNLEQNTETYAPITFEEIVTVMIKSVTVVGRNMKLQPLDLQMLSVLKADDQGT